MIEWIRTCRLSINNSLAAAEQVGGQKNELFCNNCFCYVCDVKASECQGWLTVGHCHGQVCLTGWKGLSINSLT